MTKIILVEKKLDTGQEKWLVFKSEAAKKL